MSNSMQSGSDQTGSNLSWLINQSINHSIFGHHPAMGHSYDSHVYPSYASFNNAPNPAFHYHPSSYQSPPPFPYYPMHSHAPYHPYYPYPHTLPAGYHPSINQPYHPSAPSQEHAVKPLSPLIPGTMSVIGSQPYELVTLADASALTVSQIADSMCRSGWLVDLLRSQLAYRAVAATAASQQIQCTRRFSVDFTVQLHSFLQAPASMEVKQRLMRGICRLASNGSFDSVLHHNKSQSTQNSSLFVSKCARFETLSDPGLSQENEDLCTQSETDQPWCAPNVNWPESKYDASWGWSDIEHVDFKSVVGTKKARSDASASGSPPDTIASRLRKRRRPN